MSGAVRESVLRVEMTSAECTWEPETAVFYIGDACANKIVFDLYNGGVAVGLDGWSATMTVTRSDTVTVTCAVETEKGRLCAVLPGACYAQAGVARGTLQLTRADSMLCTVVVFAIQIRDRPNAAGGVVDAAGIVSIAALAALAKRLEHQAATGIGVLGAYDTVATLSAAHPVGKAGDAYLVGGVIYVWNGSSWAQGAHVEGIAGTNGTNGKSAYALAVEGGFVGTQAEWIASLKGATGMFDATTPLSALQTTDKTVVGAINELNGKMGNFTAVMDAVNGEVI